MATLDRFCEEEGRDPRAIERSVNVGFYMSPDAATAEQQKQRSEALARAGTGAQVGPPSRVIDTLGEYERAGAQGVNLAFRPPIDWEAFEAFIEEVLPVFHG